MTRIAIKNLAELRRDVVERLRWRVEQQGNQLAWYPPDRTQPIVFTPNRANHGRDMDNILTNLRASGYRDPEGSPAPARRHRPAPAPAPAAIEPRQTEEPMPMPTSAPPVDGSSLAAVGAIVVETLEEELRRRTAEKDARIEELEQQVAELTRQNGDLRDSDADLRQQLATEQQAKERIGEEARRRMDEVLDQVLRENGLR